MNDAAPSFWKATWQRLQRNKGAVSGLVLIVLAVFLALFGYFIAPDPSPYANRIILEIGGRKPGFTQTFVQVKKVAVPHENIFAQAINGKHDAYELVPITTWQQKGDSIIAQKFIDEGVTESMGFLKSSLAPTPVVTKKFY